MSIPRIEPYALPTASELPPSRLTLDFDPGRAALLIHDAQDYFLDFFGSTNPTLAHVMENMVSLREACARAGIPVIYSAQPPVQTRTSRGLLEDMWGPGITAHPNRANFATRVAPRSGDLVLTKSRYSAFVGTPLLSWLRENQRTQLIICGVYAHIGCQCTAAEAFMNDIIPIMVSDSVADFSRVKHFHALEFVADCCGLIHDTRSLLDVLGKAPRTDGETASLTTLLRSDIAEVLELSPDSIALDSNLFDTGLDSVRLMLLVERWRGSGYSADIMDLAEVPTVNAWAKVLKPVDG